MEQFVSIYYSRQLFISLLNSLIIYDPIGWGIPYGIFFTGGIGTVTNK